MHKNIAKSIKNKLSSCRQLVLVDSSRLITEDQVKCKKLYQKLETTRKTIDEHESKSEPEYEKWLHSQFGAQLTTLRELNQKMIECRDIIQTVQGHSIFTGCPEWKAYEMIMSLKARGDEIRSKMNAADETDSDADARKKEAEAAYKKIEEEFEDELLKSTFESLFGTKKQWRSKQQSYEEAFEEFKAESLDEGEEEEKEEPFSHEFDFPHSPMETKDENHNLKKYYHRLVRKLHPDLNSNPAPKMMELWYQVQEAYESQDLSRLEMLSAMSDIYDENWEKVEEFSVLTNLFHGLKASLGQLEKKIRMAKKKPSWKFYEKLQCPKKIMQLQQKTARELESDVRDLQDDLEGMESLIAIWANPTKKDRRQKKSKSDRQSMMSEIEMFSAFFS